MLPSTNKQSIRFWVEVHWFKVMLQYNWGELQLEDPQEHEEVFTIKPSENSHNERFILLVHWFCFWLQYNSGEEHINVPQLHDKLFILLPSVVVQFN